VSGLIIEDFRTLYVDPGEDTGWALSKGELLLGAGTEKMWFFADDVWAALHDGGPLAEGGTVWLRPGIKDEDNSGPIGRIVCEDFRIYPWKAKELAWDQVRTARLIGALTFMARLHKIPLVLQGAKIKDRAVKGGSEQFFYRPLHENRHQNDAIMHYTFFTQTELRGLKLLVDDDSPPAHHPV
jgi:hypothetical protein